MSDPNQMVSVDTSQMEGQFNDEYSEDECIEYRDSRSKIFNLVRKLILVI
jgi:hypothetical protein